MTAFVPALADMIADAQLALHRLQTGQMAVRVKTADHDVEFKAADINKLQEYLNGLLLQQQGVSCPQRGAIGFVFSIALALIVALHGVPANAVARPAPDGPDLPYSCFVVRLYAKLYTKAELEAMARDHGIVLTPKQLRQAQDCFK